MVTIHTVYVITLVSQATSTVVLSILAWADRRSRWLLPLAVACGLHAAAIYLMPLWRATGQWLPRALSAVVLIGMFYLIFLGLQSLVAPLRRRSARAHAAVGALMLGVLAMAPFRQLWATQTAWVIATVLQACIVHLLWTSRAGALKVPLRFTAVLFLSILATFIVRLPLEPMVPAPPLLFTLREVTMLLLTMMAFSFLYLYAAENRRRLHDESRLDALTGLPNRRAMEEEAARQTQLAARHGKPCALLMMDLDDFKKLNDTWGHQVGDRALQATGRLLLRAAQDVSNCRVARLGGEEFAMMLSDWSVTAAHQLAEQLRAEIASLRVSTPTMQVGFTVSIGLSALQSGESTWTEMLRRADVALYRAKHEGRNRVVLCTDAMLRAVMNEGTGRLRDAVPRGNPFAPAGSLQERPDDPGALTEPTRSRAARN